jgi:hypothetical protein
VVTRHLTRQLGLALTIAGLLARPAGAEDADPAAGAGPAAQDGHVMIEVSADAVRVTEVYELIAGSRVAPRGGARGGAWIPLPADAGELRVERGADLLGYVPGGLVLVAPLEPGRHPIAFSFVVPAAGGWASVAHELPFAVETLRVIWRADVGASVSATSGGERLADGGVLEMGPRRMRLLLREAFPAGGRLGLEVVRSDWPAAGAAAASSELGTPRSLVLPVVGALAAFLLVAALAPLLTRSRPQQKD